MTAGYFGVGVYHPKTETNIGTLWRSAGTYGAAFLGTVGRRYKEQSSDTYKTPGMVPLHHYTDIEDLVEHLPHGCPLVGVELDDRARDLDRFWHPPKALYLLGAEDHGIPPEVLDRCHHVVRIPTLEPRPLNVAVAGSIVLHDRFTRQRVRS